MSFLKGLKYTLMGKKLKRGMRLMMRMKQIRYKLSQGEWI